MISFDWSDTLQLDKGRPKPLAKEIFSFADGIYPDPLRIAKAILIFKKRDQLLVSNCRPISPLSNIGKIFEQLVYSRLYSFGFRGRHSTQHARASLAEIVKQALDKGNFALWNFCSLCQNLRYSGLFH